MNFDVTDNHIDRCTKNELLFQHGINFNDLPLWQKRGVGLYWEEYEKIGKNPVTGEESPAMRRQIKRDFDLPMRDEYSSFVQSLAAATG